MKPSPFLPPIPAVKASQVATTNPAAFFSHRPDQLPVIQTGSRNPHIIRPRILAPSELARDEELRIALKDSLSDIKNVLIFIFLKQKYTDLYAQWYDRKREDSLRHYVTMARINGYFDSNPEELKQACALGEKIFVDELSDLQLLAIIKDKLWLKEKLSDKVTWFKQDLDAIVVSLSGYVVSLRDYVMNLSRENLTKHNGAHSQAFTDQLDSFDVERIFAWCQNVQPVIGEELRLSSPRTP